MEKRISFYAAYIPEPQNFRHNYEDIWPRVLLQDGAHRCSLRFLSVQAPVLSSLLSPLSVRFLSLNMMRCSLAPLLYRLLPEIEGCGPRACQLIPLPSLQQLLPGVHS